MILQRYIIDGRGNEIRPVVRNDDSTHTNNATMATNDTVIRTEGLTKQFGETIAISDIDLTITENEIFGLLGPNGAGKSTVVDILLDHLQPSIGTATVLGHDSRIEAQTLHERIGILGDDYTHHSGMSGIEHIEFAIASKDADESPDAILDRVGIGSEDAARPAGEYSSAMAQRLALGMALVGDPDLLILDEPFSELEPTGVEEAHDIVREELHHGTTVVLTTHRLDQAEALCDRIGLMKDGRVLMVVTPATLRDTIRTNPGLAWWRDHTV